jgi:predicted NAD-dependent protein-ADP-ribosyltransferase YbiA (DUF1768 family)
MKIEDSVETVNTSAKIDIFKYEWEFLSNFYPCEIVWEGITYASTEHAYQAAKTQRPQRIRRRVRAQGGLAQLPVKSEA